MHIVCIDNGHGYDTLGNRTPVMPNGKVIREWEFNHPTAKKLESVLKRCGFRVIMASDTKKDTTLVNRVKRANDGGADIFVSIHYNAYKGIWGSHGGIETLHYLNSSKGKNLAQQVQRELVKATGLRDRGIKGRNLYVLRRPSMPAIICECGFMDNLKEAELMTDGNHQWKVAEAIGKGICNYFGVKYVPRKEEGGQDEKGILYKVQIGAFRDRKNAEALAARAKKAGFDVYIVKDER